MVLNTSGERVPARLAWSEIGSVTRCIVEECCRECAVMMDIEGLGTIVKGRHILEIYN